MQYKVNISVIIPVYNSSDFISKCLDSIIAQTYRSFEIICINDGSKDNSEQIINKYINKYGSKINLINQENQGTGIARNTGLDNAKGKYIVFVDSDDTIHPKMLEKLIENIVEQDSDVAVCGIQRIDEYTGKTLAVDMINHSIKRIDLNEFMIDDFLFVNPGPCNKIHKSSIFNNIRFSSIPIVDDLILMLDYLPIIKKVSFVPEPLYYYKYRRQSLSNSIDYKTFKMIKNLLIEKKQSYIDAKLPDYFIYFIDKVALIHIGVSMLTKLSYRKEINMRREIKITKKYLEKNFNQWKKTNVFSSFKNFKIREIGLYILTMLYKVNLFIIFIKLYKFSNDILKKDIKW